jgi:hypothetical protein
MKAFGERAGVVAAIRDERLVHGFANKGLRSL